MKKISILCFLLIEIVRSAPVVWSDPEFATQNDAIVVYFDAAQGNAGLKDFTGDVYAHTGVITDKSTVWKYVVSPWPGSGNANLSKNKLERVSGNLWKLSIGYPRDYYVDHSSGAHIPASEKILKLAFVFRNADGSREGKDIGGADIFLDLYEPGLTVIIDEPRIDLSYGDPLRSPVFAKAGEAVRIVLKAAAIGTQINKLQIFIDGELQAEAADTVLVYDFLPATEIQGSIEITAVVVGTAAETDSISFYVVVNPPVSEAPLPMGCRSGINIIDDDRLILTLFAPYKEFVYVIGDFNDWRVDTDYFMQRYTVDADSVYWWLEIPGLNPDKEYGFQYLVDGSLRIADPYTHTVLDPWNDRYITSSTYPNLPAYPDGKTSEIVSTLKIDEAEFEWQSMDFQRPHKEELIIYEILLRDFLRAHDFKTLQDTLNYIERLGVNAIELMPVNEFEGNSSWGYNPSFYFALDKYYGPAGDLKALIDECHRRGIAVILDMVLNHSFGQSPMVRLYWDQANKRPAPESPWFNPVEKHPYNVGYDFNHESPATQAFVDRVNAFWLREYKVDGFRFDLSKGFMQTGDFYNYNASRIALLKRMADRIREFDPEAYIILEHLGENREETELADAGMLLWGKMTDNYNEATMGYHKTGSDYGKSDLSWAYYGTRGWSRANLVTYMESHDEERQMYKNLQYGNGSGVYQVKDLPTALNRIKLAAPFFFTIPGPKMIWQFGEVGYDFSIDYNSRLGEKPIVWDYPHHPNRENLYKIFQALIKLRREQEVFFSDQTSLIMDVDKEVKSITLTHQGMCAAVLGNFDVVAQTATLQFPHSGRWYEYFRGEQMDVPDGAHTFYLRPGELRLYTDRELEMPEGGILTQLVQGDSEPMAYEFRLEPNYPNPFNPGTNLVFELDRAGETSVRIVDVTGREVYALSMGSTQPGRYHFYWDGMTAAQEPLQSGIYFIILKNGDRTATQKVTLLK